MEDINKAIKEKQNTDFLNVAKKSVENIPLGDSITFTCTTCSGKAVAYKTENGDIWASCTKCHKTILG